MEKSRSLIGFIGIGIGAVALLMAIVHFWAGPFSPQPSLEKTVAEKAVAIKNATIAALKGEKVEEKVSPSRIDLDQGLSIATGVLGGLAIILGVVSFAKRESMRVAGGAAVLGGVAVAFQFAVIALGAIVLALIAAAVISQIGIEANTTIRTA
ncbi:MAG: hypothetical protein R3F37_08660 [Candidatus Competibacteraceae bacterium]